MRCIIVMSLRFQLLWGQNVVANSIWNFGDGCWIFEALPRRSPINRIKTGSALCQMLHYSHMRYSRVNPSCTSQDRDDLGNLDYKDFMNDMSFIYSNQRGSGSAVRWRDRDSEQIQEGRSDWLTGDVTACIYSLCFRGNSRQLLLLSKPHQGKCVTGCMSAYVCVCVSRQTAAVKKLSWDFHQQSLAMLEKSKLECSHYFCSMYTILSV